MSTKPLEVSRSKLSLEVRASSKQEEFCTLEKSNKILTMQLKQEFLDRASVKGSEDALLLEQLTRDAKRIAANTQAYFVVPTDTRYTYE